MRGLGFQKSHHLPQGHLCLGSPPSHANPCSMAFNLYLSSHYVATLCVQGGGGTWAWLLACPVLQPSRPPSPSSSLLSVMPVDSPLGRVRKGLAFLPFCTGSGSPKKGWEFDFCLNGVFPWTLTSPANRIPSQPASLSFPDTSSLSLPCCLVMLAGGIRTAGLHKGQFRMAFSIRMEGVTTPGTRPLASGAVLSILLG